MLRSGLNVIFSLLLASVCWLGAIAPGYAQPSLTTLTASTIASSGGTPLFSFSGTRPDNLGVKDGKLLACPGTPNCVNSQSPDTDTEHKIDPLTYSGTPAQALANLKSVIQSLPRTKIITETENYLYAEFTTALMGFVDDVEFFVDEGSGVIHVRSASRLGQSDLGVNRKRVEEIRSKLANFSA